MKKIKGYILYIDILGYKNLLLRTNSQEKVRALLEKITKFYKDLDFELIFGEEYDKHKLLKRFFSDNFLFIYESNKSDYLNLLAMQKLASQIQYQCLCQGILTRGSLIYGEIEFTDDIVFGCNLIKAVDLENHPEPSVIIDDELEKVLIDNNCEFHRHNSLFFVHGESELDRQDVIRGLNAYLDNFNKGEFDKKSFEKISWIVDRMNEHFRETGNECMLQMDYSLRLVCVDMVNDKL